MFGRRAFLTLLVGGVAAALAAPKAEAAAPAAPLAPTPTDAPASVAELNEALGGANPVEMQWRRRRVWRRRAVYFRPRRRVVVYRVVRRRRFIAGPRFVRRCWWNGWTTVCRVVRRW